MKYKIIEFLNSRGQTGYFVKVRGFLWIYLALHNVCSWDGGDAGLAVFSTKEEAIEAAEAFIKRKKRKRVPNKTVFKGSVSNEMS